MIVLAYLPPSKRKVAIETIFCPLARNCAIIDSRYGCQQGDASAALIRAASRRKLGMLLFFITVFSRV